MAIFGKNKKKKQDEEASPSEIKKQGLQALYEFVSPPAVDIQPNYIQIGKKLTRTLFVFTYPRYLETAWLSPIINLNRMQDIALFFNPTDTSTILKNLTKRLARIEAEIRERERQGLVRSPMLQTAREDIEELRDKLQQGKERFFMASLYVTIYADTEEALDDLETEIRSIFENQLVQVKIATLQQSQGFTSTRPLDWDKLTITNQMNTQPLSTTFPFVSADLSSDKGVLYGVNRHNNSLILFDRFSLENANVVTFGKSGGGKSYAAKLEILRSLMFGTDVIVIDPENEYQYLAETVGGTFFRISLTSQHHLNPFDLPKPQEDEDPHQVLRQNIIDLVGIFKVMLGGTTPKEDSLLDEAVTETYAARDITPDTPEYWKKTPPQLSDLQDVLDSLEGAENMSARFKKYTQGRFAGFFDQQSNVDIDNFFVVFNIRDMEEQLRPVAMYIILNYIWKRIRRKLKKRLLFIDEAWWLLRHKESGEFLLSLAKRARKYYLGLSTITQDINDFMKSEYGEPIITNSSLQMLFKQSPATIDIVQETFNLTEEEKQLLLQSSVGQSIFFAGLKHAAMEVVASYSEDQIITSDPEQLMKIKEAKQEIASQKQEAQTTASN